MLPAQRSGRGQGGSGAAAELATAREGLGVSVGAVGERMEAAAAAAAADGAEGKEGAGGEGGGAARATLEGAADVVCDRGEKQAIVSGR